MDDNNNVNNINKNCYISQHCYRATVMAFWIVKVNWNYYVTFRVRRKHSIGLLIRRRKRNGE